MTRLEIVVSKPARLPWIFVDGATQQTFRIRLDLPSWEPAKADTERATCRFRIVPDDGNAFSFQLQIATDVLQTAGVKDVTTLLALIEGKGVEIVEGAIHNGVRGDQQLVWESDGVSLVSG